MLFAGTGELHSPSGCPVKYIITIFRKISIDFVGKISMEKIISNKIRCRHCNEIIESTSVHDFKTCKCGTVSVDGGHLYLRRCGTPDDFEELSEVENI